MTIPAALDATCLIGLEKLCLTSLIPQLLSPAWVPPVVAEEAGAIPEGVALRAAANRGLVATLRLSLNAGESEVIALAAELGCRAILDDRKARLLASKMGVPVTGTVGLLLKAKESGHVAAIAPLLATLEAHQFHISRELVAEALRLAGE